MNSICYYIVSVKEICVSFCSTLLLSLMKVSKILFSGFSPQEKPRNCFVNFLLLTSLKHTRDKKKKKLASSHRERREREPRFFFLKNHQYILHAHLSSLTHYYYYNYTNTHHTYIQQNQNTVSVYETVRSANHHRI